MSEDKTILNEYLTKVVTRFNDYDFRIKQDIKYKGYNFDYIASKTQFEVERFGFVATFFILSKISPSDLNSLRDFSHIAYRYAKKASVLRLPCGLFYGILCFPVAIVDSLGDDVADIIRNKEPPKHFAAFEKLVVYSKEQQEIYYYEKTAAWGSWYFDLDRAMINSFLAPP